MTPETPREAAPRFSKEGRASVQHRYEAVMERLGKPMSAFEMAGAIGRDSRDDGQGHPCAAAIYDRRGLLNVIDALIQPETPREAGRHASERCPAQWRCRVPLKGQRGATHVSYTEPELAADLAAHFWIGCDTTHFPSKDAALAAAPATGLPAAEGLREALAEGLHRAMCFAPNVLHNRLACERPQVYLALAEAALNHPAVRAALAAADRAERGLPLDARDLVTQLLDATEELPEDAPDPSAWAKRTLYAEGWADRAVAIQQAAAALAADPQSPTGEGEG